MAEAQIDPNDITIQQLATYHDLSSFDCQNKDLNDFIKNDALKQQTDDLTSKTYLVIYKGQIASFFTVLADTIVLNNEEKATKSLEHCQYTQFPALKLGRLGVDKTMKLKGLGRLCVNYVIGLALESYAGARFLTVDSYPESTGFYEKMGFVRNLYKEYKPTNNHPEISMRFDLKPLKKMQK